MRELDVIVEQMRANGRTVDFYGGAREESVRAVEAALAVKLPPSYRLFLSEYGGGGPTADRPIAGIYRDQPLLEGAGSVYGETMDARHEFGIPNSCVVVFRDDDTGVIWCLDAGRPSEVGEYQVVSIDPATGLVDQQIASSFSEFILDHFRLRV